MKTQIILTKNTFRDFESSGSKKKYFNGSISTEFFRDKPLYQMLADSEPRPTSATCPEPDITKPTSATCPDNSIRNFRHHDLTRTFFATGSYSPYVV